MYTLAQWQHKCTINLRGSNIKLNFAIKLVLAVNMAQLCGKSIQ